MPSNLRIHLTASVLFIVLIAFLVYRWIGGIDAWMKCPKCGCPEASEFARWNGEIGQSCPYCYHVWWTKVEES